MPKYMVIANQLKQRIFSGEFSDDQQLPQEVRLTKAYNVSRITIRKALDVLVSDELIYRVQGAGTFIKESNTTKSVDQNQAELFDVDNLIIQIVNFSVDKPTKKIANKLEINRFDLVYVVERVLSHKDIPIAYQQLYFPIKYIQGMRMDALKTSISRFLTDELGVELTNINRDFSIDHLDKKRADRLNVTEKDPLIMAQEKIYLSDGAIGVYDCSWINTSKYKYSVRIALD